MTSFDYVKPKDLKEAIDLIQEDGVWPIAGGTNLLVDIRERSLRPKEVVDILDLDELRTLTETDSSIEIGSCLTMTDLEKSDIIRRRAPILVQAASSLGSPQIRNRATIGGNILSASPAADCVVALVALDAEVSLKNASGTRVLPLLDFMVGPGLTHIQKDELLTHILLKESGLKRKGLFFKLGRRNALAISFINVAIMAGFDHASKKWDSARIALGAVAPTAVRARKAEEWLLNKPLDENLVAEAASMAASECTPISDIRASENYRRAMVEVYVARALMQILAWSS